MSRHIFQVGPSTTSEGNFSDQSGDFGNRYSAGDGNFSDPSGYSGRHRSERFFIVNVNFQAGTRPAIYVEELLRKWQNFVTMKGAKKE